MLLGISETLRQYLLGAIPATTVEIGAVGDLQAAPAEKPLLLFLYAVEPASDVRTSPAPPPTETQQDPFALKLHYLITSPVQNARDSQQSLSQVLEAFHNHPVFSGNELDATISTRISRLTIQLAPTSLDDLRNVWTALGTAMQLSLYYEVNAQSSP
jgi:hypothetical protein